MGACFVWEFKRRQWLHPFLRLFIQFWATSSWFQWSCWISLYSRGRNSQREHDGCHLSGDFFGCRGCGIRCAKENESLVHMVQFRVRLNLEGKVTNRKEFQEVEPEQQQLLPSKPTISRETAAVLEGISNPAEWRCPICLMNETP